MNTRVALWIVIGVMLFATLLLLFKIGSSGSIQTAQVIKSSGGMVGGC